jgi:homoserine kinase
MNEIKVFAPASVANVGPGYDTFGFAIEELGDIITVSKRNDQKLNFLPSIGAELPVEPSENVAGVAIQSFLTKLGSTQGFDITIEKMFRPGSGLGSSASSAAGSVFAVNALLGYPCTTKELLPYALEGEALASKCYHADNVAPSLLGGFQAVRSYEPLDIFSIKNLEALHVLIIFPDVQIKTVEAKKLLPVTLSIKDAREQWGNVAAVIHALHTKDYELLNRAITDRIAEPVRKNLIPGYEKVKKIASESGSVGFNISGSGPSMFTLFTDESNLTSCSEKIEQFYSSIDLSVKIHISGINSEGCKIL